MGFNGKGCRETLALGQADTIPREMQNTGRV
jgi:hypothetical protein